MNTNTTKIVINALSALSLLAGIFGMLFCIPYLLSVRMEELAGIGLPFVASSILFGAGLITLGIYNKETK